MPLFPKESRNNLRPVYVRGKVFYYFLIFQNKCETFASLFLHQQSRVVSRAILQGSQKVRKPCSYNNRFVLSLIWHFSSVRWLLGTGLHFYSYNLIIVVFYLIFEIKFFSSRKLVKFLVIINPTISILTIEIILLMVLDTSLQHGRGGQW